MYIESEVLVRKILICCSLSFLRHCYLPQRIVIGPKKGVCVCVSVCVKERDGGVLVARCCTGKTVQEKPT